VTISGLLSSFNFRRKWAQLGVHFLRSRDFKLDRLKVAGREIVLNFPTGEKDLLEYELGQIFFDDCYRLASINPKPATILDVGANVGLFSLVARHHFPRAVIHCYEPNPELHGCLRGHVEPLQVEVFEEAVGSRMARADMGGSGQSLFKNVVVSADGTLPMTAFDTAVERIGGSVDLLKLDCEGAEWDIIENARSFDAVGALAMEYHLAVRPGATLRDIEALVESRGMKVNSASQKLGEDWGLLFASRIESNPFASSR
jgi:FkbM family methyltransferase